MATFSQKDITLLYVAKSPVALSTGNPETLNDGEIGVFTPGGTRLIPGNSALKQEFVLMQGRGTATPIVSPKLSSDIVKKAKVTHSKASVEKVDFIGYNGTSGSIDAINDNLYYVRLNIDQSLTSNHGNQYVKHGVFKTDTSATQEEIATGITKSIIANFSREPEKQLKVERVTDSATTANTDSRTITVKNGISAGVLSGAYAAATTIGNFIRIAGVAYKVVNVSGTTVFFDVPYQGASATVSAANTLAITAANANSGNWGVKLTGLPLEFKVGKIQYRKSNWVTVLDGFGNTTLTNSATAFAGNGTFEQAAELEWFLRGNDGEFFRKGEPNIYDRINDVVNATYGFVEIDFSGIDGTMTQVGFNKKLMLLVPSSPVGSSATAPAFYTVANGLQLTLEALLGLTANTLQLN